LNEFERIFKSIVEGEEIFEGRSGSSSSRANLPLTQYERYDMFSYTIK